VRIEDFVRGAVKALVQAALAAETTEGIDDAEDWRSETRLSPRSSYYSRSLIIRVGTAVACAAGSDECVRPDLLDLRNSEASLSASRSDGEASHWPPRSKRSHHRNALSAGKSRDCSLCQGRILVHVVT
jgi:hypothetical protein